MRPTSAMARVLALCGYLVLLIVLPLWHGWLAPPEIFPPAVVLTVLLVPLLLAAPGLWRAKRYTHAWVSLLVLPYFALGVDAMAAGVTPAWIGPAIVTASVALFTGAVAYIRLTRSTT